MRLFGQFVVGPASIADRDLIVPRLHARRVSGHAAELLGARCGARDADAGARGTACARALTRDARIAHGRKFVRSRGSARHCVRAGADAGRAHCARERSLFAHAGARGTACAGARERPLVWAIAGSKSNSECGVWLGGVGALGVAMLDLRAPIHPVRRRRGALGDPCGRGARSCGRPRRSGRRRRGASTRFRLEVARSRR